MKKFPLNETTYYDTFDAFVEGIKEKFGSRPAVTWFTRKQEEKSRSYKELSDDVTALRRVLCDRGLEGCHIALAGENSYEWIVTYLAITSCGAAVVALDQEQPEESIWQMLDAADVKAVFASEICMPLCRTMPEADSRIRLFALLGEKGDEGVESIHQLFEEGKKLPEATYAPIKPRQTATIVFTSGTTSVSKPVMLSHQAILYNAGDFCAYIAVGKKVYTSLPFYHTYGWTAAVLAAFVRGVHLLLNGNLKTAMRDLHLSRADSMLTVPLMMETIHNQMWINAEQEGKTEELKKLLKRQKFLHKLGIKRDHPMLEELRKKYLGTLQNLLCGGAHLNKEIAEVFQLLGFTVILGYGITECSPLVAVNSNHSYRLDSVGHIIPNTEVKIVDEEIWVRGINVMNGYYKSPELTAEVMEGEWFKTGDLGYLDKEGFLYITGRKKNLIVFNNGKKVSPEELEEKLRNIPLVKEVMVYGAASGVSADDVKVAASIYPEPERVEGLSSYEILERLQGEINEINAKLPFYKQIRMVNIQEQEFAKTATKKIKRHFA